MSDKKDKEVNRKEMIGDIDHWIGQNAFGLGCEVSVILKSSGVPEDKIEETLKKLFRAIRYWDYNRL